MDNLYEIFKGEGIFYYYYYYNNNNLYLDYVEAMDFDGMF
jgi:hypothetical protein